jgi:hypothetical protein
VQPVGTDRTVSVELAEHGEIHLYTKVAHVRSQKRTAWQMVKFWQLWITFITKNPEASKNFPEFSI